MATSVINYEVIHLPARKLLTMSLHVYIVATCHSMTVPSITLRGICLKIVIGRKLSEYIKICIESTDDHGFLKRSNFSIVNQMFE